MGGWATAEATRNSQVMRVCVCKLHLANLATVCKSKRVILPLATWQVASVGHTGSDTFGAFLEAVLEVRSGI